MHRRIQCRRCLPLRLAACAQRLSAAVVPAAHRRDGTFGTLLSPKGEKSWAYDQAVVTWDIQCELGFVLYNQCILSALVAIILMTFGSVVFVALVTALCLCFGLCNCCWVKRKFAMDEDETVRLTAHCLARRSALQPQATW